MAYDDSRFAADATFRDGPAYGGSGAFGTDVASDYGSADRTVSAPSAAELAHVFDDPPVGQRAQLPVVDRMAVHFLWEGVLLIGTLGILFLLRGQDADQLRGKGLHSLLLTATVLGLVAVGVGLTVRAAVVNLALGPVAYACAMYFTHHSADGLAKTAAMTLGLAAMVGVVVAVCVAGLNAPAWAASLGVGLALMVWVERQPDTKIVAGAFEPGSQATILFGAFVAASVLAALIGMIQPVRRGLGSNRRSAEPSTRPSAAAATTAAAVLVGSTITAGLGGLLMALQTRTISHGDQGLTLTAMALGAVLLGGTSVFGRRGGVFGTVLAVMLLTAMSRYAQVQKWHLSDLAIAAAAILAGLVVTRLVESFGKSDEWGGSSAGSTGSRSEDWGAKSDPEDTSWAKDSGGDESWASQPARSTGEAWDNEDRWVGR